MAFFKFRKRGDDTATPTAPVEGVEVLRKRAKHRLIGTVILVLAGVVGFPLLVDKQPRPIAVDIPIDIPDKNKVKPLLVPSASVSAQQAPSLPKAVATGRVLEAAAPAPEPKADAKANLKAEVKAEVKAEPEPEIKTPVKPVVKAPPKEAPATPPAEGRFVVQVGAFAEADKAREARLKLERAGLKTYTQEVQTKDGTRIRVRVGPFGTKADVDKAADKIKKLDLPAAILTL